MPSLLRQSFDKLATLVRAAIVVLALTMLLALTLQIFMRSVLGQALSWTEELALACFSWSMLLAIALGVRELIHVRMDLLVERLAPALQNLIGRVVALATALLGAAIAWAGVRYVLDSLGTTSAAIGYPIAWLYASAPVCGVFITLFAIEQLLPGAAPTAQSE